MEIPAHLGYLARHVPIESGETLAAYLSRLEVHHAQLQETEGGDAVRALLQEEVRDVGARSFSYDYEEAVERMHEDVLSMRDYMTSGFTDDDIDEEFRTYPE